MRKKLIICIATTLITGILSSLPFAISFSQKEENAGLFLLGFVGIFANIFLALFLTVCIYAFAKEKIIMPNLLATYLAWVGILLIISATGFLLISLSNASSNHPMSSELTIQDARNDFDNGLRGYLPVALLYSFLIPIVYYLIEEYLFDSQSSDNN